MDQGSFQEVGKLAGRGKYDKDGKLIGFEPASYVMGIGTIDARTVAIGYEIQARRTGKPPLFSRDFFEYCLRPSYCDNRRAREELGASFRSLDETLADALADFRERGAL